MTTTRRGFLAGLGGLGAAAALGGCATGSDSSGGGSSTTLTLQNSQSDADPKAALTQVVDGYTKQKVTLNTIAIETFRAQLPTYLNSANPPDVLTWYAGSVARDYAKKGFLLDVSELWTGDGACAKFSPALKELSTAEDGKQIFVPTNYYWWGVFYKKSAFAEWGVQPPTTWDEFIAVCKTIKSKGAYPLTMGTGSTAWVASGWFDYLNLRINGAKFHRELLAGQHAFDGPEVKQVMDHYRQLIEYIDPKGRSYSYQDAVTPLVNKKAGMYLLGAFITSSVPQGGVEDIDFFRVPSINTSVPVAEEAPTDGYFAAARTKNKQGALDLLSYLAGSKQQQAFIERAKSSNLPTSSEVDVSKFSPLVQKGVKHLNETEEITQFFNRDSSDELQTTADTALTKFLDKPGDVNSILKEWQASAKKVLGS
ncbi:ABC transporter substrate-binding protein [Cryptosporangium sp. NPDC048952]|uniref:ABC transporter substrate-binding protein n=1 Tax=Cryptosporangium sp. NPDC048952 TaxID=3363961 RepID=UPI00371C1051